MKADELIELLAERPFVPVRIHMSNGRTHEIRHPELAIVGEDVVAIGVESETNGRPRLRFASIAHINELELIGGSASAES